MPTASMQDVTILSLTVKQNQLLYLNIEIIF